MNQTNYSFNRNRKQSMLAGTSLLLMAAMAIYAYAFVFNRLIVTNDAASTYLNITNDSGLFTSGIAAWVIVLLMDLLVTWLIYTLFEPVHKILALISSGLRLIYSICFGVAIYHQFGALQLVLFGMKNSILNTTTLQNEVLQRLMTFEAIWSFGLILFGLHLITLSLITFKTKFVSRWISVLLMLSGLSYMLIHVINTFFPSLNTLQSSLETLLSLPMAVAELSLALWFLIKGGKPYIIKTDTNA